MKYVLIGIAAAAIYTLTWFCDMDKLLRSRSLSKTVRGLLFAITAALFVVMILFVAHFMLVNKLI